MKKTLTLLFVTAGFMMTACNNSTYSSGKNEVTTLPPDNLLTPYSEPNTVDPNYSTEHCGDITGSEHMFYGFMKNKTNEQSFAQFLNSQINCSSYNGWMRYENGNHVFYQYQNVAGTRSCDFWSKQPAGITVDFFKGYTNTATIAIDATGNGWAASGPENSQGYPVNRMVLNAQIDCSKDDLTIHSLTRNGWLSILVPKENGNKNSQTMRAEVFFNGSSLGKYQLRRSN